MNEREEVKGRRASEELGRTSSPLDPSRTPNLFSPTEGCLRSTERSQLSSLFPLKPRQKINRVSSSLTFEPFILLLLLVLASLLLHHPNPVLLLPILPPPLIVQRTTQNNSQFSALVHLRPILLIVAGMFCCFPTERSILFPRRFMDSLSFSFFRGGSATILLEVELGF